MNRCQSNCHENQNDQDDYGKWIPVGVDKDDDGIPTLIIFACSKCGVASWTATRFCGYCGTPMKREIDNTLPTGLRPGR